MSPCPLHEPPNSQLSVADCPSVSHSRTMVTALSTAWVVSFRVTGQSEILLGFPVRLLDKLLLLFQHPAQEVPLLEKFLVFFKPRFPPFF